MAKKIIWSKFALENKLEILTYWIIRNRSNVYSTKLNRLLIESAKLIRDFQSLGKATQDSKVKYIMVTNYLMFYEEHNEEVHIVHIWDQRRNPDELMYNLNG
jgi:plasmid stabilization system protein ParE